MKWTEGSADMYDKMPCDDWMSVGDGEIHANEVDESRGWAARPVPEPQVAAEPVPQPARSVFSGVFGGVR